MIDPLALVLFALGPQHAAPPRYRPVVLSEHGGMAFDLSESGAVVGWTLGIVGPCATYWDPAGRRVRLDHIPLGEFVEYEASEALGISDDGSKVVGWCSWAPHLRPVVWDVDTRDPHVLSTPTPTFAVDVNDAGDVLIQTGSGVFGSSTLCKRNGRQILIGRVDRVSELSHDGRVCGRRYNGSSWVAFRWSEAGGIEELPIPAGFDEADGWRMNAAGAVAGTVRDHQGIGSAVVWGPDGTPRLLSGSLPNLFESTAADVNASGWVVGAQFLPPGSGGWDDWVPTLWIDGNAYDIEDLIEDGAVHELFAAFWVNDAGQILAYDWAGIGVTRIVRLDPIVP